MGVCCSKSEATPGAIQVPTRFKSTKYEKLQSKNKTKGWLDDTMWSKLRKELTLEYQEPPGADDMFCIKLSALTYFSRDYFVTIIEKYIDEPIKDFGMHLKCASELVTEDGSTADRCFPPSLVGGGGGAEGARGASAPSGERFLVMLDDAKEADCHAYIVLDTLKRKLYVSVRPTGTIRNWITNMHIRLKNVGLDKESIDSLLSDNPDRLGDTLEQIKVHTGFFNKYIAVVEKVTATLLSIMDTVSEDNKLERITWTGLSMGASVVTLLAWNIVNDHGAMLRRKSKFMELVLFGSPRTGNAKFADFVSKMIPVRNIINEHDPVPKVPWNSKGYWHVYPCMKWKKSGRA